MGILNKDEDYVWSNIEKTAVDTFIVLFGHGRVPFTIREGEEHWTEFQELLVQGLIPKEFYQTTCLVPIKTQAQEALALSDKVALRCFKAGVLFPPEWSSYVKALRAVFTTGIGPLPLQPPFPEGS